MPDMVKAVILYGHQFVLYKSLAPTFGSIHFEGSKNFMEDDMCSRRNSLERIFLGRVGDIVLDAFEV